MEFLSDEQAGGFGRFRGDLPESDLDRFFYLDDADRDLSAVRRGDHNLGASLLFCAQTRSRVVALLLASMYRYMGRLVKK